MNKTTLKWTAALVLSCICIVSGCKQEDTSPGVAGEVASVDTSAAEKEFQSAPPEVKSDFDAAIASVKSGDYSSAVSKLQSVAQSAKLTDQQKQVLNDLVTKVQKAVTEGAAKAVEGAEKAIGDVKNTLPK